MRSFSTCSTLSLHQCRGGRSHRVSMVSTTHLAGAHKCKEFERTTMDWSMTILLPHRAYQCSMIGKSDEALDSPPMHPNDCPQSMEALEGPLHQSHTDTRCQTLVSTDLEFVRVPLRVVILRVESQPACETPLENLLASNKCNGVTNECEWRGRATNQSVDSWLVMCVASR